MYQTIGFIGTGNMGSAIAKAAGESGLAQKILLSNRTLTKAAALANNIVRAAPSSNKEIARTANLIFLGVKPQVMGGVLEEISPVLKERKDRFVLVTMAAGLSCQRIRDMAGTNCPVIRMMPNTPAAMVDQVPESLIDAASAVSGCGPAFAYLFVEALADGGVACGLPRDKAAAYAAQMLAGSARMVLESGQHPGALKDAVCSPGGTTIQGVRTLEERGFRAAVMDAVIAAYEKTLKLC